MEPYWVWGSVVTLLITCYVFVRRLNGWYYDLKLGKKQYLLLPPGDMGWPFIGNLLAFMKDFSSGSPDSFIRKLVSKYGESGMYKTHLFGNPSIIVCAPEECKQILTDDENFKYGYPKSVEELTRTRALYEISNAEHKRFRRQITAPIVGHSMLAMYLERIEEIVSNSLEEMSSMTHPIEMIKELKEISFKVIIHVFIGSYNQYVVTQIGDLFTEMHKGLFSLPVNLPGFAFHSALKARKKLTKIVEWIVQERRLMIEKDEMRSQNDLIDILLHIKGDNGRKMEDEDIIDLLMGFLFSGRESTAFALMWSIKYLTQNPNVLKKAKEEQEEIMKKRPQSQKRLSLEEVRQMVYLSQVIDEMLRHSNLIFSLFREATADVMINGYLIPKGWRVLLWTRDIHMNPKYYANPEDFNPSRWEDNIVKAGTFLPFGIGSRLCPGSDLAKLEISTFLHYFILNYRLEQANPECSLTHMPTPKPKDNCLAKVIKISCA